MYHYMRCGLDNVWLLNGYHEEDLGEYGRSVVVEHVEGLERAIARRLVDKDRPLTGQVFRFLRVMLDLSQTSIGQRLRKGYQTVSGWEAETRRPVPRFADVAIRARYLEFIGERPLFIQIEDRLAKLSASASSKRDNAGLTFKAEADGQWHDGDQQVMEPT